MADFKAQNPDELGALWEKSSAKGPYMTGTINGVKVVVFKNGNKRSDQQPDWRVMRSKPREDAPQPTVASFMSDNEPPFAWLLPLLLPALFAAHMVLA